ncbi:aminotransferase class IV [Hyphobacterium sp. HN65]|uniref:Probable branched-chain-amino-acid aminotransferase n=1 Tax=Hyphobacterium lacteum TaxID=3116575 RepID=A0ABU7LPI3_9PROT|nr:aminotransferase class IV [Hyphobacterium sp. HN65]MEE2525519.1 aminotransferase class IV [Hyphobacterium sp. HN65]
MYWRDKQKWVEAEPTATTLGDRAFQLGDGVFETFRIDNGAIRHGQLHRASLEAACDAMALAPQDWRIVESGVRKLMPGSGVGKLQVTRGPGGRGLAPLSDQQEALYLQFSPLPEAPDSVRLAISSIRRSTTSLAARYKTMSYADNLAARREAVAQGADMALMLTEAGFVSGGDSANLFWIRDGEMFTPSTQCAIRNGVMRQSVMHWAQAAGVEVKESAFNPDALASAECAFVSNAVMGVTPVAAIDGRVLPVSHDVLEDLLAAAL